MSENREPRRCWAVMADSFLHDCFGYEQDADEDAAFHKGLGTVFEVVPMVELTALQAAEERIRELERGQKDIITATVNEMVRKLTERVNELEAQLKGAAK